MNSFLEKAKNLLEKNTNEDNIPSFTKETGIVKITNFNDLEKFLEFTLPSKYYKIDYFEPLKYFEIKRQGGLGVDKDSIRVDGKDNKIHIYVHNIYEGDSEEKLFDYHEISDMNKYLIKTVGGTLPTVGL